MQMILFQIIFQSECPIAAWQVWAAINQCWAGSPSSWRRSSLSMSPSSSMPTACGIWRPTPVFSRLVVFTKICYNKWQQALRFFTHYRARGKVERGLFWLLSHLCLGSQHLCMVGTYRPVNAKFHPCLHLYSTSIHTKNILKNIMFVQLVPILFKRYSQTKLWLAH